MASILGTNRRKAAAQERIEFAVPALADRFGIAVAPIPTFRRDQDREAAERAEWVADVLEALAMTPKPSKPVTKAKAA